MGVRSRLSGTFYAEIRADGARLTLGTFDIVEQLNFKDYESLAEAEFLDGYDGIVTTEQHRRRKQRQRRISIAQADERAMKAWVAAFPQDVIDERAFYAQKKAERRVEKEDIHTRKRFI
jgi:hypothetical protein